MRKKLDRIVVIDVESTCWDDREESKRNTSEIIQVGIAALDVNTLTVVQASEFMVKPVMSKVSSFCTRLTGITQEEADAGIDFAGAISVLVDEYEVDQRPWASYGDYDRKQFAHNCKIRNVHYPFGDRHINVKTLVASAMGWPTEEAMDVAMGFIGLTLKGRHHKAGDDAANIANILGFVLHGVRQ